MSALGHSLSSLSCLTDELSSPSPPSVRDQRPPFPPRVLQDRINDIMTGPLAPQECPRALFASSRDTVDLANSSHSVQYDEQDDDLFGSLSTDVGTHPACKGVLVVPSFTFLTGRRIPSSSSSRMIYPNTSHVPMVHPRSRSPTDSNTASPTDLLRQQYRALSARQGFLG